MSKNKNERMKRNAQARSATINNKKEEHMNNEQATTKKFPTNVMRFITPDDLKRIDFGTWFAINKVLKNFSKCESILATFVDGVLAVNLILECECFTTLLTKMNDWEKGEIFRMSHEEMEMITSVRKMNDHLLEIHRVHGSTQSYSIDPHDVVMYNGVFACAD